MKFSLSALWASHANDQEQQDVSYAWSKSSAFMADISHQINSLFSSAVPTPEEEQERTQSKTPPTEELQSNPEPVEELLPTLSDEQMEALKAETHDETFPLMPNAPVVVAAASCEDVVLRWRGVETDAAWPIHGYVVQRFPDADHKLEWATILESVNASESTDRNVRTAQQYLYRVQAVSGAARSPFAYDSVSMNQSTCYASKTLMAYLPPALQHLPWISTLSVEAVQTFVLIISCFLAVFGVMRSNVKRVQHTRSRQGRLKKMEKSTLAESKSFALPRLSSSDASTEAATSVTDVNQFESSRSLGALTSRANEMARENTFQRAASFSTPLDKAVCQYCHKKFGIFRRRRVCDVCESVALCRKCGGQAPVKANVADLRRSLTAGSTDEAAPRPQVVVKASSGRKRRVKTICRDCNAHAERYSTSERHL